MALPFPRSFLLDAEKGSCSQDVAFEKAVNLTVATLNWLHLRRPASCPDEIVLFQPLGKVQWRIVRFLQEAMTAWNLCKPVDAVAMGRTAGRVEEIEVALSKLASFESEVNHLFEDSLFGTSGTTFGRDRRFSFSPGLQKESPGSLCGRLPGADVLVAKPIEASRLEFRGRPEFNPSPFLDPLGRKIFEEPLSVSCAPEDASEVPPVVRIHGKPSEVWKLLRALDASGRLGVVRESEIIAGYGAGLFSVPKDQDRDRLIFDCRPMNTLQSTPQRWISSMASASNLLDLQIPENGCCFTSGTDLREFYYTFAVSHERLVRNTLLVSAWASEIRDFNCYTPDLEGEKSKIHFGLRTLGMGDVAAVEIAQTAHIGILVQHEFINEDSMMAMNLPVPRDPFFTGVVIDDLILFEIVCGAGNSVPSGKFRSPSVLNRALSVYEGLGLIPHKGKTFCMSEDSEFWGALFEGRRGFVRANLKRTVPVLFSTLAIIKLGVCTVSLLETLVGCWASIFLFKRRLLSILNVAYEAISMQSDRRMVIRLSDALKEEFLLCVLLAPVATTYVKSRNSKFLWASDASDWGWAVVRSKLPEWLQSEIHRHRLNKPVWSRLLSPLRSLQRLRGNLPPAEELPDGVCLASHPLHIELSTVLPFQEVCKKKNVRPNHINVTELRGMIHTERAACFEHFPGRSFSLADSQVALGCWLKGRSSSISLNQELQQSLPYHVGCGTISNCGFVPSEVNVADDPTRFESVRSPSKEPQNWLYPSNFSSSDERFFAFDSWLESYGAGTYEISGLPPLDELRDPNGQFKNWRRFRSKEFFSKKKAACQRRRCCRDLASSSTNSTFPADEPPVVGKVSVENNLPTAEQLGRDPLPLAAVELLQSLPFSRFLFPDRWQVDSSWRPNFAGYLDLYSGKKGVARMMIRLSDVWAITFEVQDDENQDVLLPQNKLLIEQLIRVGAVFAIGAAIFCHSFSRAVRPPVRSSSEPYGLTQLSYNMSGKVAQGNLHALWLAGLIKLAIACGLVFWVENPDSSFLWYLDEWIALGCREPSQVYRVDYCRFNCAWRKRTRFFLNTNLGGHTLFCLRDHSHRKLVGWSKMFKMPWTRVAQVYPTTLCRNIASSVLSSSGILPLRKRVSAASVAGHSHCRIGEAKNPGPRKFGQKVRRERHLLDEVQLVEPVTSALGLRVWESFRAWCLLHITDEAFESCNSCPMVLVELVEAFGKHLFEEGSGLYLLRQLVTHIQRERPNFKFYLTKAWRLISKWEVIEPVSHRTPLPPVVFRAMVVVSILWGWRIVAGILLLTYEGICRPGETLAALRQDLLLPRDLLVEAEDSAFLLIRKPKGKRRGLGAVQHVKIQGLDIVTYLDKVFGDLPPHCHLFPGAAASFRRRWDALLDALCIPKRFGLTPASLRGGGAVKAYRADQEIGRIMWRMRLKNMDTLKHYLQEAGAMSVFVELPQRAKNRVQTASCLYSALLSPT